MKIFRKYEKLITFDNAVQANLLRSLLDEKDIPHVIISYHDSAYDGIWQEQKGWGFLEAPDQYHQQILDIYEDIKKYNGSRET